MVRSLCRQGVGLGEGLCMMRSRVGGGSGEQG